MSERWLVNGGSGDCWAAVGCIMSKSMSMDEADAPSDWGCCTALPAAVGVSVSRLTRGCRMSRRPRFGPIAEAEPVPPNEADEVSVGGAALEAAVCEPSIDSSDGSSGERSGGGNDGIWTGGGVTERFDGGAGGDGDGDEVMVSVMGMAMGGGLVATSVVTAAASNAATAMKRRHKTGSGFKFQRMRMVVGFFL